MPRYRTLGIDEAETSVSAIAGLEPLILDGKLVAIIVGPLRIYADRGALVVSEQDETSDAQ